MLEIFSKTNSIPEYKELQHAYCTPQKYPDRKTYQHDWRLPVLARLFPVVSPRTFAMQRGVQAVASLLVRFSLFSMLLPKS